MMKRVLATLLVLISLCNPLLGYAGQLYRGDVVGGVGGVGNVVGPASSVDNSLVRFDSTTGKLIQDYTSGAPVCGDTGLCTFTGAQTMPTVVGGTTTTSTLTLQPTSGVGTTGADIIFKVGNNGATEAGRFLNNGQFVLGDGTSSLPSHTFSSTPTMGMYRASSSVLGFSATGAQQFAVNATGGYAARFQTDAGTVASPSLQNAADTNTGIYFPTADTLGFVTGGVSRWTVDSSGGLNAVGVNGQAYTLGHKTELTTIAAAATTTTTITIPANAILKAVTMRVTTVIPTAATMVVTATTTGTVLQQGASISVAAGTTDIGTRGWGTNYQGVAAQTITITPDATPANNTGRVRFDIFYEEPTVPTS